MASERLRPLFDWLVVKELDPDKVRKSGLVLPDTAEDGRPPHHGIVVSAGPGLEWWGQADFEMPVKAGDHIVFPFSAGTYVEFDEEKLLTLRVGQVIGVVEDVHNAVAPGAHDEAY